MKDIPPETLAEMRRAMQTPVPCPKEKEKEKPKKKIKKVIGDLSANEKIDEEERDVLTEVARLWGEGAEIFSEIPYKSSIIEFYYFIEEENNEADLADCHITPQSEWKGKDRKCGTTKWWASRSPFLRSLLKGKDNKQIEQFAESIRTHNSFVPDILPSSGVFSSSIRANPKKKIKKVIGKSFEWGWPMDEDDIATLKDVVRLTEEGKKVFSDSESVNRKRRYFYYYEEEE